MRSRKKKKGTKKKKPMDGGTRLSLHPLSPDEALDGFMKVNRDEVLRREKQEKRKRKKPR